MASFPKRGWVRARAGQPVYPGDSVRTGDKGKARLTFFTQAGEDQLDLGPESYVKTPSKPKSTVAELQEGFLRWWNGEEEPKGDGVTVRTPTVVAGISDNRPKRGASFHYDKKRRETVVITGNNIRVWTPDGPGESVLLRAGQKLTADSKGLGKPVAQGKGEWDRLEAAFLPRTPEPAAVTAGKPDLSKVWSSTYGKIHFSAGWYGKKENTLAGSLTKKDGKWVYRGTWGRRSSKRRGGVEFVFTSATSFTGTWWRETSPRKTTAWSGSL